MRIKGSTEIVLTDVRTGEREIYKDDNLVTNWLTEYFANCGMMNYPNVDMTNLVESLLGGVMAFDQALTESASTVTVPEGAKMIANGCVGVDNVGDVLELGSYSDTESGWVNGAYVQAYDYGTSQANGTIATICLTGKDHGYMGEGNSVSGAYMSSPRSLGLIGSASEYLTAGGIAGGIDLAHSTCYSVDFSDISNGNITIRRLRLPINKINVVGTPSVPVVLSETTITAPSQLVTELTRSYNPLASGAVEHFQDVGSKMMILSRSSESAAGAWGSTYTQYLWELDYAAATITQSTILNTSGEDLRGIVHPVWLDEDTLAWIDGYVAYSDYFWGGTIYYCHRTSGVWGSIGSVTNPLGAATPYAASAGWYKKVWSDGQRAIIGTGTMGTPCIELDTSLGVAYPTNAYYPNLATYQMVPTSSPLILGCPHKNSSDYWALYLYRYQGYIASVNVLASPVVKDATKTMKITYRLTFSDSEV